MALLNWKDEYLIGIRALDFEHQDLFERINDLYESCARGEPHADVGECLGRLHSRLAAHFALEEKTMREMKNPTYPAHKAEHDRFLEEVTENLATLDTGSDDTRLDELAMRVKEWIVDHITTYDRSLDERGR